ncbi:voltage-gated potassium channel [Thermotomaculum hydrothermale]|uniref:Voltage-gated potassium channel n=1 Tax=Thermotomaculum hydrothermale TaxID=981385 RepID=A0A7R6PYS5_9BACT|nr:potassium channel protein [Thermotomaculum hydrothermale]BBB32113.1 voltage-gated potassium channel [Thermotomaculum hydrothermale]
MTFKRNFFSVLYLPLTVLFIILTVGTVGYILLEKANFLDSLYMTVITLTTVGFREVIELDTKGKIFTIFLILMGVGLIGYTISSFSAFFVEGGLTEFMKGRKMEKAIKKLKNHIIICGFGENGSKIAELLKKSKRNVVVVDSKYINEMDNYYHIVGDATDDNILEAAGIREASVLVAALPSDADNIFVSITAKALNKKIKVIAKAKEESSVKKMKLVGIDEVVYLFDISARRIANLIISPHFVNMVDIFSEGDVYLEIAEIDISKNSHIIGKSISEINLKRRTGLLIVAIKKPDGKVYFNPDSDYIFEKHDVLLVMGTREQIEKSDEIFN